MRVPISGSNGLDLQRFTWGGLTVQITTPPPHAPFGSWTALTPGQKQFDPAS